MPWLLPALVIGVPILEIYTFVKVAGAIGFFAALGAAILAGLAGLALLRHQGFSTLMRARAAIDRGELPVVEALDGILLAVAGGMLLLPGFLSDAVAILLLLPPVRQLIRDWLASRSTGLRPSGPTVLDGDFVVVDPDRASPSQLRLPDDNRDPLG